MNIINYKSLDNKTKSTLGIIDPLKVVLTTKIINGSYRAKTMTVPKITIVGNCEVEVINLLNKVLNESKPKPKWSEVYKPGVEHYLDQGFTVLICNNNHRFTTGGYKS